MKFKFTCFTLLVSSFLSMSAYSEFYYGNGGDISALEYAESIEWAGVSLRHKTEELDLAPLVGVFFKVLYDREPTDQERMEMMLANDIREGIAGFFKKLANIIKVHPYVAVLFSEGSIPGGIRFYPELTTILINRSYWDGLTMEQRMAKAVETSMQFAVYMDAISKQSPGILTWHSSSFSEDEIPGDVLKLSESWTAEKIVDWFKGERWLKNAAQTLQYKGDDISLGKEYPASAFNGCPLLRSQYGNQEEEELNTRRCELYCRFSSGFNIDYLHFPRDGKFGKMFNKNISPLFFRFQQLIDPSVVVEFSDESITMEFPFPAVIDGELSREAKALTRNKYRFDAVNATLEQSITIDGSNWTKFSKEQKIKLLLHEFMGLSGLEAGLYSVTLEALNLLSAVPENGCSF